MNTRKQTFVLEIEFVDDPAVHVPTPHEAAASIERTLKRIDALEAGAGGIIKSMIVTAMVG